MACDGIWDCVNEQKLCEEISQKLKKKEKISNIIGNLMDRILAQDDNGKIILHFLFFYLKVL